MIGSMLSKPLPPPTTHAPHPERLYRWISRPPRTFAPPSSLDNDKHDGIGHGRTCLGCARWQFYAPLPRLAFIRSSLVQDILPTRIPNFTFLHWFTLRPPQVFRHLMTPTSWYCALACTSAEYYPWNFQRYLDFDVSVERPSIVASLTLSNRSATKTMPRVSSPPSGETTALPSLSRRMVARVRRTAISMVIWRPLVFIRIGTVNCPSSLPCKITFENGNRLSWTD